MSKFFVVDLQITEACDTLAEAREVAEDWIENERQICADADDETIEHWARGGERGLDAGDVIIYEVEDDDSDDWRDGEEVERYSGREVTEAEAEKRGIRWIG